MTKSDPQNVEAPTIVHGHGGGTTNHKKTGEGSSKSNVHHNKDDHKKDEKSKGMASVAGPPKKKGKDLYSTINQEDLIQVGSLAPECAELKFQYEECFNNWFGTNFLIHKQHDMAPCTELLKQYTACVKSAAARLGIPIDLTGCPPVQPYHHHRTSDKEP